MYLKITSVIVSHNSTVHIIVRSFFKDIIYSVFVMDYIKYILGHAVLCDLFRNDHLCVNIRVYIR